MKVIGTQVVRDSGAIHEILVRVEGATQGQNWFPWVALLLTVAAAITAATLAQLIRAVVDDNRRRERVRQKLMLLAPAIELSLQSLHVWANAWQLPRGGQGFWQHFDWILESCRKVEDDVFLLEPELRAHVMTWFLRVASVRFNAEALAGEYGRKFDESGGNLSKVDSAWYHKVFERLEKDAEKLIEWSREIYQLVYDGIPEKRIHRFWAEIDQPFKTLAEAQEAVKKARGNPLAREKEGDERNKEWAERKG